MNKHCILCTISGHVQGVWFRAATKEKANELGITGWVRNLKEGDVQTQACGTKEQLKEFSAWLYKGPKASRVESVIAEEVPCEIFSKFKILRY